MEAPTTYIDFGLISYCYPLSPLQYATHVGYTHIRRPYKISLDLKTQNIKVTFDMLVLSFVSFTTHNA